MQRKEDGGQNSKGKRSGFDKCNQGGRDALGCSWLGMEVALRLLKFVSGF